MKRTYFVVGELITRKTFNIIVHADDMGEAEELATKCALNNNNMFITWHQDPAEREVTGVGVQRELDKDEEEDSFSKYELYPHLYGQQQGKE